MPKEDSPTLRVMRSHSWSGVLRLEMVQGLNERGLALLKKAAQASEWADGLPSWKEIIPVWASASEGTVGRAARSPMVLLDFNFQDLAWWSRMVSAHPAGESRLAKPSGFYTDEVIPLARDLLLEAWSASRSMTPIASLVFGMAPEVTALIARLSPSDVDRVVVHEAQEMRPRWANRPMFWRALCHAATRLLRLA